MFLCQDKLVLSYTLDTMKKKRENGRLLINIDELHTSCIKDLEGKVKENSQQFAKSLTLQLHVKWPKLYGKIKYVICEVKECVPYVKRKDIFIKSMYEFY